MNDGEQNSKQKAGHSTYDGFLFFGVLLLMAIGLVMVYSASSAVAAKRFGSDTYFLERQAIHVLASVLVILACRHIPYPVYGRLAYPLLGLALVSLIALWVPGVGHTVGGARRWLKILGTSFQPSEFARLAVVVYLAYSMAKKHDRIKEFSIGFLPHALVLAVFAGLTVIQPDFGMAAMMGLIAWFMLFLGGVRVLHLTGVLALMLPAAYWILTQAGYRIDRLTSFADPWRCQNDEGYQIVHSLMAFGSGGILGAGIGNGYQKLFYLPEPHTDFVLSVVGEELGLIGVCAIIGLYVVVLWRGVLIAMRSRDFFAALLAAGLTTAIGLQVCVNAGVALGLLPTKGLTLPFLSYGGTSLLINAAAVGILLNISARQTA